MTCPRSCSQAVGEQDWSRPGAGLTKLPLPRRRVWGHAACKQAPFPEKENQSVEEARLHSEECPQQETRRAPRRLPCSGPESISEQASGPPAPSRRWAPGQALPGSAGLDTPQLQPRGPRDSPSGTRSTGAGLHARQPWASSTGWLQPSPEKPGGHRLGRKWLKGAGRTFLRFAPHSRAPGPAASSARQERKGPKAEGGGNRPSLVVSPPGARPLSRGQRAEGRRSPGRPLSRQCCWPVWRAPLSQAFPPALPPLPGRVPRASTQVLGLAVRWEEAVPSGQGLLPGCWGVLCAVGVSSSPASTPEAGRAHPGCNHQNGLRRCQMFPGNQCAGLP